MPKKVIQCQSIFRPGKEAVSNEIVALRQYLKGQNITTDLLYRSTTEIPRRSFVRDWLRLKFYLHRTTFSQDAICHVWSGGKMLFFHLLLPDKYKNVITLINVEGVTARTKFIRQYSQIVVEAERDKQILVDAGIEAEQIQVIYPFSPYKASPSPQRAKNASTPFDKLWAPPLRLLFASVPFDEWDLENRGVDLLLEAAIHLGQKVQVTFLCRTKEIYQVIRQRFAQQLLKTNNIIMKHGLSDMLAEYAQADAVILPFRKNRKSCPNSMVEAVSLGKPVIMSEVIAVASLVKQEGLGVVVSPKAPSICAGIEQLMADYESLAQNCLQASLHIFNKNHFLQNYHQLYQTCALPSSKNY